MLIRINTGMRAGIVQDVPLASAKIMLADGRATAIDQGEQNGDPENGIMKLLKALEPKKAKGKPRY